MPGPGGPAPRPDLNEEGSVRHLIGRFGDPGALRACYEAEPCGFELHRLLVSMKVACDAVAPSLIPRRPGDRVETDKRDASRLARLHRAGGADADPVPSAAEEAVRTKPFRDDHLRPKGLVDLRRAQDRGKQASLRLEAGHPIRDLTGQG